MSWLWIYITLMEWVGIVLVVKALGDDTKRFSFRKTGVYFCVYVVYSVAFDYFSLPPMFSVTSYLLLFAYIWWTYRESFIRNFNRMVLALMIASFLELLLSQIVYLITPSKVPVGLLEVISVTCLVIVCFIISNVFKLYRILNWFDKWDYSYALVAGLSMMVFAPVIILRVFRKLAVQEYIYIMACVFVMWVLVSKIQKTKLEERIRKKYLESFTEIISQIRRRQHKMKNQFDTAFGMYKLYPTYDELVAKQKEYLGRLWDYELPTDAIILEDPVVVALLYQKINEAIENGIQVITDFSCSMVRRNVSDVIWVQILGTLLDNAIESLGEFEGTKKLWIEIREDDTRKGKVSVSIVNAYQKKKQKDLEKFFELGYSTKGENRGIGLYDVKMLVDKQRGNLIFESIVRDELDCFKIQIIL